MTTMTNNIQWIEVTSYDEMSKIAARIFEDQLLAKPNSVLGFATGGTPVGVYKELVASNNEGEISFKQVTSFNLDEYVGIPAHNPASYWTYMNEHLFNHIDIQPENIHIPNGTAADMTLECTKYDELIVQAGGIDLQLLGIGVNGHIGFNEPGTSFDSLTHIVELADTTRSVNAVYFEHPSDMPTHAVTMGIQSIMKAKVIVLMAFGKTKYDAMERLKSGIVTEDFPASCLLNHPNVTIIYGGIN